MANFGEELSPRSSIIDSIGKEGRLNCLATQLTVCLSSAFCLFGFIFVGLCCSLVFEIHFDFVWFGLYAHAHPPRTVP